MDLIEHIKKSLRISHSALDDVLLSDIYSGADELMRVGVDPYERDANGAFVLDTEGNRTIQDKHLIIRAIDFWVKSVEDFEEKGEKYMKSFEKLRDSLSLSGDYHEKRIDNIDNDDKGEESEGI